MHAPLSRGGVSSLESRLRLRVDGTGGFGVCRRAKGSQPPSIRVRFLCARGITLIRMRSQALRRSLARHDPSNRRSSLKSNPALVPAGRTSPRRDGNRRLAVSFKYVVSLIRSSPPRPHDRPRPRPLRHPVHLRPPRTRAGTLRQLAVLQPPPQGNKQLAGQRHDAHLPRRCARPRSRRTYQWLKRAVRLPAQPAPGQLDQHSPHASVAGPSRSPARANSNPTGTPSASGPPSTPVPCDCECVASRTTRTPASHAPLSPTPSNSSSRRT